MWRGTRGATKYLSEIRTRAADRGVAASGVTDWIELVPEDPRYPLQLREGAKDVRPPTLFCRGNLELLASDRLVAIVGSRRARAGMRARLQKFSLIRLQARRSPEPMNGQ
ncbi:DNA-processing protein DprA [Thermomicrobium roseum]|uniref:Smf/DprA SLOG domain-containing protein n=1 Tax=Thermomicrobium roseum (strain ATCC 27502 / DSM 5159 / P-2) TaxID=309801 RepID=B9L201_THERP|nr:hypothetical protein trd_1901 [Thermomicrobium roseum DSM 5159]